MTAAERLRAEEEKILAETGFYIPPFRLANLTKAAGKITDILIKADTNICYEECKIILKIAAATIAAVTEGGKINHGALEKGCIRPELHWRGGFSGGGGKGLDD